MKLKFPKRKRLFRWLGIFIGVAVLLLYIVMPAAMGVAAIVPQDGDVDDPPAGFTEITLTTTDNVELAAWYAEPKNGAVIILIHGAGDTRDSVRGYAEMLVENDFGVLAFDMRGFGESGGDLNRLGWKGTLDVGAAMAYLRTRPEVETIGGLGLSLGGEVLLGAASAYPDLRAIVADGATCRSLDEYTDLPANRALYRNFTNRVFYLSVRVLTGDRPPTPLLDSMREAAATEFLFIAAGNDDTEIEFNEYFTDQLAGRANVWIVPDVGHTGGFKRHPSDYEQRVIPFFEEALIRR